MTEPTETERAAMNARLARAMGWTNIRWHSADSVSANHIAGALAVVGTAPDGRHFMPPPDFIRDPAASRELVVWLGKRRKENLDACRLWLRFCDCFTEKLFGHKWDYGDSDVEEILFATLTAPPLLIAMAADAVIGGSDER